MRLRSCWSCLVILGSSWWAQAEAHQERTAPQESYAGAVVRVGRAAEAVERNAAELLARRLREPNGLPVRVESEADARPVVEGELLILLGVPEHHETLRKALENVKEPPLTELDPGVEGFVVRLGRLDGTDCLLAAGIDPRGVVYAAGQVLRQTEVRDTPEKAFAVVFGSVRTAPAFEVRGTQFGQSSVARDKARVRPWTVEETESKIADYVLAGANTMQVDEGITEDDPIWRFIRGLGVKTLIHYGPNIGQGPPQWQAKESIGRLNYLCPSVPEARQALLDRAEALFRRSPDFDYVRFPGGDGGGCECDRCDPYGKTFILLCEDLAEIVHRYHPKTEIFITNQKFDNADDIAIFEYLRAEPRPWLRAFCYGPGSDAMSWQPGHRQTHRMDLFRYPGFGPYSRYLHEILHQLPPQHDLVFFNELTHWRYSQNGFVQAYPRPDRNGDRPPPWNHWLYERMPDRFLTQVYDRLTFYAWPKYYHWLFGETVRYGIGDVTHSSGTHDHFNQWMWQRLLWAPHRSVEDVVLEYARSWFGPEAAEPMAEAIFLMEQYLRGDRNRPLLYKDEVDRYYDLVKQAGERMEPWRREKSWLWREYMQKGAIDKRTKLAAAQQLALQERIDAHIGAALMSGSDLDAAADEALRWLAERHETDEMRALREEAERLGEESNALYGVRSEGIFNLDHDFIGLGWTKRQLERARTAPVEEKREWLAMIADYTNPGEGGFYDNCGSFESAPRLVNGYPYDFGQPYVPLMLDEANRLSQRTMCYTQDEPEGVAFRYEGLDPQAAYRVRLTLVRPRYQERYTMRMNQRSESLYADDILVARDIEVPERMSDHFTFGIPREATADGRMTLRFEKAPDVAAGDRVSVEQWRNCGGWGTIVSEVWLMKR